MTVRRTVPNIEADHPEQSREFYAGFLGLDVAMEREEIITFASPSNPTAQISAIRHDESDVPHPNVSIEVADGDEMHARAVARGIEIVYPLTDEPWGVRRFFALDPNGTVVNILSHR